MSTSIQSIFEHSVNPSTLWDGTFKIPWDEPEFSKRMLREHLSQDHDLASRTQKFIEQQVAWIHAQGGSKSGLYLLDLACGPGLYTEPFARLGYRYRGIDFSPASVEHANSTHSDCGEIVQGDICSADYGGPYDVVCFIYGEFNVFSAADQQTILRKSWDALKPGGRFFLEVQSYDSVKKAGESPANWYRSGEGLSGLFSDKPHLVLVENHWIEEEEATVQDFHVVHTSDESTEHYRNTTRALSSDKVVEMIEAAGFMKVEFANDWPVPNSDLQLVCGKKL